MAHPIPPLYISVSVQNYQSLKSLLDNFQQWDDVGGYGNRRQVITTQSSQSNSAVARIFPPLGKMPVNEFWELGIDGQSQKSLGHNFLQRSGELYLTFMTKRKQKPPSSSRFPSNQPGVSRGGQDRGLRIKNSPIRAVLI